MKQIIKTENGPYILETRKRFTGCFWLILLSLVVGAVGLVLFSLFLSPRAKLEAEKEAAITQALADSTSSVSARFAHMMLQTASLQQGGCFVASADGFPPDESMMGGKVEASFSHYKMLAYVISANKIESTTLPLCITLPTKEGEEAERIQLQASISPLTEHLYTAEFSFPREKMPEADIVYSMMWIQCGTGKEYKYTVYASPGIVAPAILMNDSLSRGEE